MLGGIPRWRSLIEARPSVDAHDVAAEFGDEGWEKRAPEAREAMLVDDETAAPVSVLLAAATEYRHRTAH